MFFILCCSDGCGDEAAAEGWREASGGGGQQEEVSHSQGHAHGPHQEALEEAE